MYMLGITIKLSMLFKFWGCGVHLRKHFLDLGLEINTKKV